MKFVDLPVLARCVAVIRLVFVRNVFGISKLYNANPLLRLNAFLDHVDVGDYVVFGDLEAYSCASQAPRIPGLTMLDLAAAQCIAPCHK